MIYWLFLLPLILAAVTFAVPSQRWRPWLLPLGALGHLGLVLTLVFRFSGGTVVSGWGGWLVFDALGRLFCSFLSLLFFLCSLYAPGYLAFRSDRPNRVFCANLFV